MGRKRKAGKRYTSGKSKGRLIVEQRQRGNERVAAKLDYWNAMCWQGGGHGRHSDCPVGLLWLTGNLDGHDVEGEELVAAFNLFVDLRRTKFGCPTAQAIDYAPKTRTTGTDDGNVSGVSLFNRLNDLVFAEEYKGWQAIQSLMFDAPFCRDTEDQVPYWVQRFIDEAKIGKGHRVESCHLPSKIDRDRLEAAVKGLSLIVAAMGGKIRKDKAA